MESLVKTWCYYYYYYYYYYCIYFLSMECFGIMYSISSCMLLTILSDITLHLSVSNDRNLYWGGEREGREGGGGRGREGEGGREGEKKGGREGEGESGRGGEEGGKEGGEREGEMSIITAILNYHRVPGS